MTSSKPLVEKGRVRDLGRTKIAVIGEAASPLAIAVAWRSPRPPYSQVYSLEMRKAGRLVTPT